MDPAFLRRLPYKIEIGAPSVELYKQIFTKACQLHGMALPDETFNSIVSKIRDEKELELAAFQPGFLLDQVVASCRFMEQPPHLEPRFLNYAIDNLRVKKNAAATEYRETAQLAAD
jgi:SpoVK/Ycf46/Vps4 family AAA+-type ATPase